MNVDPAFVADGEAPEPGDPGEGPLHDPSMFSEMAAALDAFSGDMIPDAVVNAGSTTAPKIISFVSMELAWSAASASPLSTEGRNGVKNRFEHPAVMNITATQRDGERVTLSISDDVALRAETPAVRGVWARRFTPSFCCDGRAVHTGPAPVQPVGLMQADQQLTMETAADIGHLPVTKASPACHARPAAHLSGQHLPWNPGQGRTVGNTRMTTLRARGITGMSGSIIAHSSSETRGEAM